MTKFEKWFIKRVFAKEVRQGYFHDLKILAIYQLVRDAAEAEFTEDNAPTLDAFLKECFDKTQVCKVP